MKIEKVINNNVVSITTPENIEYVLMGKGLGFQKKAGDELDESRVEKKFVIQKDDFASQLRDVYKDIPPKEADAIYEIILEAEKRLNQTFDVNVYLTLADHIHYAIQRTDENIEISNPLTWEVKRFYKKEFAIGKEALSVVEEYTGVRLSEGEAASIALHFVNAQKEGQLIEETVKITRIVRGILNVVRLHFGVTFDEESISYNRFLTHLQYFAQRVVSGEVYSSSQDTFLLEQVKANYPEAFKCTNKVADYIENNFYYTVEIDEKVYLAIHIERVVNKN